VKKFVVALLTIFSVSLSLFGVTRTEQIRAKLVSDDRNYVFVTMHRGDWRNYPENSRDAIRSAIALGADIVELDVRMTKDGRFVLSHDEELERTTDGTGKVSDHTLAELKQLRLRAGSGGKDAPLTDYQLLSLEEALELTRGRILVNLDKFMEHPREILETVDRIGAIKEVLVKSTLKADKAKEFLDDYWPRVLSGELLYMPVVLFCWGDEKHAAEMLPGYLRLEPRIASMYEVGLKDESVLPNLDSIRRSPGAPRLWLNTMWDVLAVGYGEAGPKSLRIAEPDAVWGRALGFGATMLQTDYGAELLVYLNRLGRHAL